MNIDWIDMFNAFQFLEVQSCSQLLSHTCIPHQLKCENAICCLHHGQIFSLSSGNQTWRARKWTIEINDFPGEINLHSVRGFSTQPWNQWNQRVVHKNLRLPILFCARASWCRSHDFLPNVPRHDNTLQVNALLVKVDITMERSTISNGRTHYKWDIFNSYVKSSEGNY